MLTGQHLGIVGSFFLSIKPIIPSKIGYFMNRAKIKNAQLI
jgi:hypothetical protein